MLAWACPVLIVGVAASAAAPIRTPSGIAMPHSERPSSPEEHTSDQYFIYRLEHDLYELFEEQQLLLEIVAQQQERLERQLEMQRMLLSEPPAMLGTTLPELLPLPPPLQLEEISAELEAEPDMGATDNVEPELMAIAEPDEPAKCCEEFAPPPRCVCTEILRKTRRGLCQDNKGAKCTPPKRCGLGYDVPFPYPKRMAKSRERRALFIFTLVDGLLLQLQRCMSLAKTGGLPLPLPYPLPLPVAPVARGSSVVIVELEPPKKEPPPTASAPTGALPKPKFKQKQLEISAKRSPRTKAAKRLNKQLRKTTSQLDPEIDLDCEFGMDYIEKFRANRVREDEHNTPNATPIHYDMQKSSQGAVPVADEPITLGGMRPRKGAIPSLASCTSADRDEAENDILAAKLASLAISENTNPHGKLTLPGWYDNSIVAAESQQETRPCTPELPPFPLLPADGFINLLPSTSAQARALALAMSGRRPESSHSSVPPSPFSSRSPMPIGVEQQPLAAESLQSVPGCFTETSINQLARGLVQRQVGNGSEFSGSCCGGYRLGCGQAICSTGPVLSPLPPGPPPPSPVYNHLTFDSTNQPGVSNGNIQLSRMDICDEDFAAPPPDRR